MTPQQVQRSMGKHKEETVMESLSIHMAYIFIDVQITVQNISKRTIYLLLNITSSLTNLTNLLLI